MLKRTAILLAGLVAGTFTASPAHAQDYQAQLWDASISGDTVAIAQALDAGAKIDSLDTRRNPNGRRALNWAAYNDRGPAVRLLIARGASLNLTNVTGFTPVHHAAEAGATETLTILLQAGADITIANNQGLLPLDTARARGHANAIQLLEAGAKKP
jgi:ankyrin repeat protein